MYLVFCFNLFPVNTSLVINMILGGTFSSIGMADGLVFQGQIIAGLWKSGL